VRFRVCVKNEREETLSEEKEETRYAEREKGKLNYKCDRLSL